MSQPVTNFQIPYARYDKMVAILAYHYSQMVYDLGIDNDSTAHSCDYCAGPSTVPMYIMSLILINWSRICV